MRIITKTRHSVFLLQFYKNIINYNLNFREITENVNSEDILYIAYSTDDNYIKVMRFNEPCVSYEDYAQNMECLGDDNTLRGIIISLNFITKDIPCIKYVFDGHFHERYFDGDNWVKSYPIIKF